MSTEHLDHYVVIGNPVAHSLSPEIHAQFARQTGCVLRYGRLLAPRGEFARTADRFFADGGCGANVTVPFKEDAARFAQQLTERADLAGAVNTIKRLADGQFQGDNTDGAGLLRDLEHNLGLALGGLRILLLGAGGAAHGVMASLLRARPAQLVVANRTAEKAARLAQRFAALGPVQGLGFADAPDLGPFDLIINATSAGLSGETGPPVRPEGLFATDAMAYDMIYGDKPTAFLRWASQQGAARTADGWGMLVEQAAESFALWRGQHPDTAAVIRDLRPGRAGPQGR